MDTLYITALQAKTYIGVHAWEQSITQTLLIDITLPLDCSACEDELQNTVDYDALCKKVTEYIESNRFQLIETVANNTAILIKETYSVPQVTVSVSKPQAIKNARDVRIVVTR